MGIRSESIEDVLVALHLGQWFGWGGKEKIYENLVIHSADEKPTQEWLEEEIKNQQAEWDAKEASKQERLDSVKAKLEVLGLTSGEIKDAFDL
jgi:hypothetical protein